MQSPKGLATQETGPSSGCACCLFVIDDWVSAICLKISTSPPKKIDGDQRFFIMSMAMLNYFGASTTLGQTKFDVEVDTAMSRLRHATRTCPGTLFRLRCHDSTWPPPIFMTKPSFKVFAQHGFRTVPANAAWFRKVSSPINDMVMGKIWKNQCRHLQKLHFPGKPNILKHLLRNFWLRRVWCPDTGWNGSDSGGVARPNCLHWGSDFSGLATLTNLPFSVTPMLNHTSKTER